MFVSKWKEMVWKNHGKGGDDDLLRDFSENRLSFDLTEGRFLGEKVALHQE